MASFWQYHDYSTNTAAHRTVSPSLVGPRRSLTPLILPHDWLESTTCYSSVGFGDDVDFQSNHLELSSVRPPSESLSLSGLGIRNFNLTVDLPFDNPVSEVANIFDSDVPIRSNSQDFCEVNLEIFSRKDSNHEDTTNFDVKMHNSSGSISVCGSPWSFSSVLKGPELAVNDSSTDHDSAFSTEADPLVAQTSHESDVALSFKELSAAAGLSLADFAAQLSATAEAALSNIAADGITPAESNDGNVYDPFQFQANFCDIAPKCFAADFVLPFDNSVFRTVPPLWSNPCAGVNPADVFPTQQLIEVPMSPPTQLLGLPSLNSVLCNEAPRNDNLHPSSSILQRDANLEALSFLPSQENRQLSEDEHSIFQSPSSSEYSPCLPGGQKKTMPVRNNRGRISRSRLQSVPPLSQSRETPGPCDGSTLLPLDLGTPVFDAHRGIDIDVLKAKAERYRLRNQGRDYDKRWLISFAGKLSPRGELMEEFRCYIAGCKQTNKRRDHILIHVGAHLDQRPFKCMYCSSRFLRKNECKRHELSHTGIRPFSCHLCPFPSTTFVRQDLLKRHMKRTHRVQFKSEKENETLDRPKKRGNC